MVTFHGDCIEIHYVLDDKSHQMDAYALNKGTHEILSAINAFAKKLNVQLKVEAFALGEGGIREWLKIVKANEDKSAPITTEVVKYLVLSVFGVLGYAGVQIIDYIKEDHELNDLKKAVLIKYITDESPDLASLDNKVSKLRSNYYNAIQKSDNVDKVQFASLDNAGYVSFSREVPRGSFPAFILSDNLLEPKEVENAIIQITSPVIAKGDYNMWHGYYNGEFIAFKMLSNEFKTLVQQGEVSFKNGFSIQCLLRLTKSLMENGDERMSKYEVIRVDKYFISENEIETREGRVNRQKQTLRDAPNLFTNIGFE